MVDAELPVQVGIDAPEQGIVDGGIGLHEMHRQRRFGGAHAPDVQVVHRHDARQAAR